MKMTTAKTLSKLLPRATAVLSLAAIAAACSDGALTGTTEPGAPSSETAVNANAARPAGRQRLAGHVPAAAATAPVIRRLEPARQIRLAIGLPLRDPDGLKKLAGDVSDPSSPAYRHYLTPAEVAAEYGPTESDYAAVAGFARAHGLAVLHTFSNRVVLHVTGAVADVERALNVRMNVYLRNDGTEFFAPDAEPSLELNVPLLHIAGLDDFEKPHPLGSRSPAPAVTKLGGSGPLGGLYTGGDLRAAYASCTTATGAGQTLGLMEFDGYTPSDVVAYNQFGAGQRQVPLNNVLVGGATGVPAGGADEVTADIELANGMAPGLAQIDVFEGPPEISATDTILDAMTTTLPLATTISNSWWTQIDATSQQLFDVMAAQGQSFFTSSGDSGSYPANLQGLINATSGVTIVGGTNLAMNGTGASYASETALNADGFLSGGGVECCEPSVAIPSYQTTISMATNGGSTTNRNAPDVSIAGGAVFLFFQGNYYGFYGTSVSAPLWAAFAALANQASAASGAKPLGFANPRLYSTASASSLYAADFNDVADDSTNGSYFAVKGYDLVTGLGTPKCELVAQLACVPKTACGLECGTVSNGCGGTLVCPPCELHCPLGEGNCGGYCCRCVGTTCS